MDGLGRGAILGVMVLALGIQGIRPGRTNPPVASGHRLEDVVSVPAGVENVITHSCQDCHSNVTVWPWYSNVAPISWWVIGHVNNGRRHLNFSDLLRPGVTDPPQYVRSRFQSACREVRTRRMPLWSYVLIHRKARLSEADMSAICDWANQGVEGGVGGGR